MIDIGTERLLRLGQAACQLPPQGNGKRIHASTLYRWSTKGCRGVRLETVQVGGSRVTSVEAIQRFVEALTLVGAGSPSHER